MTMFRSTVVPKAVLTSTYLMYARPTRFMVYMIYDQVYSNTRVPTQVNTNRHESDTSQHESGRVRHKSIRSDTSLHESIRPRNYPSLS